MIIGLRRFERSIIIFVVGGISFLLGIVSATHPTIAIISFISIIVFSVAGFIVFKPRRTLFVFLMLLPMHQMMMMLILHFFGSWAIVKFVQPWKDILALSVLFIVTSLLLMKGKWFRLSLLDWLIAGYILLNFASLMSDLNFSVNTRLLGLRANLLFVIFYFLGRTIPLTKEYQRRFMVSIVILGTLAGVFTLIDRFLLPIDWPARIGLTEYLSKGSGITSGKMGLSWTYWTASGLRRSSSFFANPLDLASSVHLTGVTALVFALSSPPKSKGRFWMLVIFSLIVVSLLLSISRTSTVVFFFEVLLVLVLMRRYSLIPLSLIAIIGGIGIILIANPQAFEHIYQTITLENPSSKGHLASWLVGFQAILQNPFGLGPGTSGWVGTRAGSQIGGESQYIVLGVELGLLGVIFYILLQITAILYSFRLFKNGESYTGLLALITLISRIGIMLTGITAIIESYIFIAFINWLLIGFVSQQMSILPRNVTTRTARCEVSAPSSVYEV